MPYQSGSSSIVDYGMHELDIIQKLSPHLSEERRTRIERVVAGRTRSIVPVVEGIVNIGNVSAVMRSAEALGFQDFHLIAGEAPVKKSSRTTQGADKWIDVHAWQSAQDCVQALRSDGYRVVVTHLSPETSPISTIDFSQRTAIVFGNELNGVSRQMVELADETCKIPMPGFVESFNISVAAAIALHHIRSARFPDGTGDLSESDRLRLTADFYQRSVRRADMILKR